MNDAGEYGLILGAGLMQRPSIEAAKELGYRTLVVDANPDAVCVPFADRFEPIDLKDREALADFALSLKNEIAAVFTAGTDFSASVSYIAEKLGLQRGALFNRSAFFERYTSLCRYGADGPIPAGSRKMGTRKCDDRAADTDRAYAGRRSTTPAGNCRGRRRVHSGGRRSRGRRTPDPVGQGEKTCSSPVRMDGLVGQSESVRGERAAAGAVQCVSTGKKQVQC